MARNVRRNRTTEDQATDQTAADTSTSTEGGNAEPAEQQQAAETSTSTEGNAAAPAEQSAEDAARDPFAATFEVEVKTILDSEARAQRGETFVVLVHRLAKRSYTASLGDKVSGDPKQKAKTAIAALVRALGLKEAEVSFDAEEVEPAIPETAGSNEPTKPFYEEESEIAYRLRAVGEEFAAAGAMMTGANKGARTAWLGMGRAYNKAKAIFAEAGLSENGDSAGQVAYKTTWGKWLTSICTSEEHAFLLETFKSSKNAAAQAGFMGLAPEELLDLMDNVGTPSTFERKVNEMKQAFASQWAGAWVKEHGNEEAPTSEQLSEGAAALLGVRKAEYAKALADWQEACVKAAKKTGKSMPAAPDPAPNVLNVAMAWLDDMAVKDMDAGKIKAYAESRLGAAMMKSWEALSAPGQEKATQEQEAAKEKEAEKAVAVVSKRFADMEVEDAARHLFGILRAHAAAADVLETLHEQFDAWVEEQTAKEEAAKAADAAKAAAATQV